MITSSTVGPNLEQSPKVRLSEIDWFDRELIYIITFLYHTKYSRMFTWKTKKSIYIYY